jgi:hypothetical protein
MPFEIEFIRNTLKAEGIHLENDGPLDSFYNFAVAIREQTIKELQGGPHPFIRLTDEEILEIVGPYPTAVGGYTRKLFDTIQDKLEEKNNG